MNNFTQSKLRVQELYRKEHEHEQLYTKQHEHARTLNVEYNIIQYL